MRLFLGLGLLALYSCASALAQTSMASVVGITTDPSGAVVLGAVTAKFVQYRYVLEECCGWVMRAAAWCSIGGGAVPRSAPMIPARRTVMA